MNALYDAVVKTHQVLRGTGGFGLRMFSDGFMMAILARAFEGDDISADGKRSLVFEPPQRDAYRWLYDLSNKEGALHLPSRAEGNLWAGGTIAFYQEGSRQVPAYDKLARDLGVPIRAVLFPRRKDGKRPSQVRVGTWNTGTQSARPDHGWALIKHLTTRDAVLELNRMANVGALTRPDLADDPFFAHPNYQVFLADSGRSMPQSVPHIFRGDEFENTYRRLLVPWLAGDVGFEDGLRTMRDDLQRILDLPPA
jgi:ABC-type glycerol-3-phosphate transport system substrate-binding protein